MAGRTMKRRDDAGSTHVLEAVIIATIMLSAVAYVATFETAPSTTTATRPLLKQKSQDALAILYDTPVSGSSFGDNQLSIFLAQCMQGNCTNMTDKLDRLLPTGSAYAIYISNGYETFPVYVEKEPRGEAVTATHLLEPRWSHSFVSTGLSNINSQGDSLIAYTLPVFNSNVLSSGGSPLRVLVHGTRLSDGSNFTLTGFFSTQSIATADALQHPAVSLNFLVNNGGTWSPGGYADVTAQTIDSVTGAPTQTNVTFKLRVTESANVALKNGTELTVRIPRGWTASALQSANDPTWLVLSNATSANSNYTEGDIVARLLTDVQGNSVDFTFNAKYHDDYLDNYPFQATLSKGGLSEANLLVRADRNPATSTAFATPTVLMSVPRPMGATATTTWTITVDIPNRTEENVKLPKMTNANTALNLNGADPDDSSVQAAISVDSIEIIEQDGVGIFSQVIPVTAGGAWASAYDRLYWNGSHLSTSGPLSLTFQVKGSGVAGSQSAKNPFVPPIQFGDWKGRIIPQVAAGFYRDAFLPSNSTYKGYEGTQESGIDLQNNFTSNAVYRSTSLPGRSNYTVSGVSTLQDSFFGSYVNVERRTVPVGGTVVMTADIQSLLYTLANAGLSAGVKLRFYPPWAGDTREPIYEQPGLDSGILHSEVTQMTLVDVNNDGYADPVIGTNNGRVLALHALTGARIQGNAFVAAPLSGASTNVTTTSITHLSTIVLDGETYIVVGTDEQSGLYVLDKSFQPIWRYEGAEKVGKATLAMDTSVDIDGDGRNDIIIAVASSASASSVYVFRAIEGSTSLLKHDPLTGKPDGSFYQALGQATSIVGLRNTGPGNTSAGFGVTFQRSPGVAGVNLTDILLNQGENTTITIMLPGAGFQGVDRFGNATWTYGGSPVTISRAYDFNGDQSTDVVGGSPAGFVMAINGSSAANTIPGTLMTTPPARSAISGDHIDARRGVQLSDDGTITLTRDGWIHWTCAECWDTHDLTPVPAPLYPTANAVAMNGTQSIWIVGASSLLMRSELEWEHPDYPHLVTVTGSVFARVSVNGQAPTAYDLTSNVHDFQDVFFRKGAQRDLGWVVGTSACLGCEALVMRTVTGGLNWTIASKAGATLEDKDGNEVTAALNRINFTNDDVGWIAGDAGTLLRSLDGGQTWRGVDVPTTADLVDVSCAPRTPSTCLVISGDGYLFRSQNALATIPDWTNLSSALGYAASQRILYSVGMVDASTAYLGGSNMVLKTLDGGANWTTLPMSYMENDGRRVIAFPDGTGYVFGGNVTNQKTFYLNDYAQDTTARTLNLNAGGAIPPGATIQSVALDTAYYGSDGKTTASFYVSVDGGATWKAAGGTAVEYSAVNAEHAWPALETKRIYEAVFNTLRPTTDLRVAIDLDSAPEYTFSTAYVTNLTLNVTYTEAGTPYVAYLPINLDSTAQMDATNTTAAWDVHAKVIRQRNVPEYWTRNVSGEVKDIQVGYNVSGDWRQEVYVATGGVIAGNSPDYNLYAGSNEGKWIHDDNRIYILDGSNGTILNRSESYWGNVTQLRLADPDQDNDPDTLFATVYNPDNKTSWLLALNPYNLTVSWQVNLGSYLASDLEAGRTSAANATGLVALRTGETVSQNVFAGRIYNFEANTGDYAWSAVPDEQGYYVLTKDIPANWFFGPYVVEIEVNWTAPLTESVNGLPVTRSVFQTARFYDYFLVTPPDALSPPSPVYDVHLVTWFEDWR